ncbi:MAG TPA: nucleoside triphosphate pyrophosphatase [Candidatus Polarisedimenticolaceae bacterium]|nr:nucleoside triphosphate pyrophosphatase [Candidatus Polarisedimenticolaceae bacterium]
MPPLVLASASPRRRALLSALGLAFELVIPDVDESVLPGETARAHVERLAAAKTRAASSLVAARAALVLAADTTVTLDGTILGKPQDAAEALAMIERLSGRCHDVLTACRLLRTDDGRQASATVRSAVRFRPWDEALARWYVATGEPMDKAGAYALQGRGVLLTDGIEGSWSNVVGLPLEALPALFAEVGDDLSRRIMEGGRGGC